MFGDNFFDNFFGNTSKEKSTESVKVNEVKTFSLKDVRNINIDADCDIIVRPSQDENVKVKLSGEASKEPKFEAGLTKDGNLSVKVENEGTEFVFGNNSINISGNTRVRNFSESVTIIKCEVFVPEEYQKDMQLDSANSNIKLSSLNLNEVEIDSQNGSIDLAGVNCKELNARTNNGSISLGTVKLESGELDTNNGNIELDEVSCNEMKAKSNNGNVSMDGITGSLKVETDIGKVKIKYITFNDAYKVRAKSSLGNIILRFPRGSKIVASTKTNMGNIENDFEGNYGTPNVIASTSMGNIKITEG